MTGLMAAFIDKATLQERNEMRAYLARIDRCEAVLHTGPGHQSRHLCEAIGGPDAHDKSDDGELVHRVGYFEWTGDVGYD